MLDASGTPDPTFGGDGFATPNVTEHSAGVGVAMVGDKVVVAATVWGTPTSPQQHITDGLDFAVVRLKATGTLDKNFGKDGFASESVGDRDQVADFAVLDNGSLLVAGTTGYSGDYAIARFTAFGASDPVFGVTKTNLQTDQFTNRSDDGAHALAVFADGRFVVVGTSKAGLPCGGGTCDNWWISAVRYKDPGPACTIIGTRKADRLSGTSDDDVICPLEGANVVHAGGGADYVYGPDDSRDDNSFYGGDGGDHLYGGAGDDLLSGGPGKDRCLGGPGRDRLISC